jgi:hypothetical protein
VSVNSFVDELPEAELQALIDEIDQVAAGRA